MQDMLHKMLKSGHPNYEVVTKKAPRKPAAKEQQRATQKPPATKKS